MRDIELIEQMMEQMWNAKDVSVIDQRFAPEVICHSPLGDYVGPERFTQVVQSWLDAFPDLQVDLLHTGQEADTVVAHWVAHGTHKGTFKGVAASGSPVRYHGISYYKMQQGRIIEYWACVDMLSLMGQVTGERPVTAAAM